MKTLLLMLSLMVFHTTGCGLGAYVAYHKITDTPLIRLTKSSQPLVEAVVLDATQGDPLAQIEESAARILVVHQRAASATGLLPAPPLVAWGGRDVVAVSPPYDVGVGGPHVGAGRVVVLAVRSSADDEPVVSIGNAQSGLLAARDLALGDALSQRGWASVDIDVQGQQLRVIGADLASQDPVTLSAWRAELASGPGAASRDVVYSEDLVGADTPLASR